MKEVAQWHDGEKKGHKSSQRAIQKGDQMALSDPNKVVLNKT